MERKETQDSPSQIRIKQLKQLKENKEKGIYSGIPLWESFPKLAKTIPTLDKGQVIMNFAASGVGKSMLTRWKDIVVPWLFVRNHPELNIDLKFVIFLLEDSKERLTDYFISILLFLKYGVEVSPKRLNSKFKEPLTQDILDKIDGVSEELDDLLSRCVIEDSIFNSYGIYKRCRLLSEDWGVHYYSNMLEGDNSIITKAEYNKLLELPKNLKDLSLQELKDVHNIDPVKYKDFFKYDHYEDSNPNRHVVGIVDNLNCLEPDKYENTLKVAMEKLMYGYARKIITKHWNWTWVAVQQSMGAAEEQQFDLVRGNAVIAKLIPNLSQLGDSKVTQRACHLIYALFYPFRYDLKEFLDYDLNQLGKESRFLFVLKNNDGDADLITPLLFLGASNYFQELELQGKDMSTFDYNGIKQRNFFTPKI